ncbi:MAG: outer membrane protein assembly factor [Elusimicrobia bacterium]|nr:outer membrane protein assembly factor [Candidatus Liberimonas magnetica]
MKKIIFKNIFLIVVAFFVSVINLKADISEAKLKEMSLSFSPDSEISLPNGVIDLSFQQTISSNDFNFSSRYDYLDNYIFSNLDYRYHIKLFFFGFGLSDKILFETFYSDAKYIQRNRYIMPYLGINTSKNSEVTTAVKFEETYTAGVDSLLTLDRGKNAAVSLGFLRNTLEETLPLSKGSKTYIQITKSFDRLGSDYDYTSFDTEFSFFSYPVKNHFIRSDIVFGYPLSEIRRPLTSVYAIGGIDLMRGYKFREFLGDSLIYWKTGYHIPLSKPIEKDILDSTFKILTIDIFSEAARIGDKYIFERYSDTKASFGIGFSCTIKFFQALNTAFAFSVNKAIDSRAPTIYMEISTISYERKNKIKKPFLK